MGPPNQSNLKNKPRRPKKRPGLTKTDPNNINFKKKRRFEKKKNKINALLALCSSNGDVNEQQGQPGNKVKRKGIKDLDEPERKKLRKDVKYLLNGQEKTNEVQPVFGVLTDEQKIQVKRLLELRSKKRSERASLELEEIGVAADLRTPPEKRHPLTIDDFQTFIIYSLLNKLAIPPRWVSVSHPEKVMRRIFVVVEGAGLKEYLESEAELETLSQFETRLEIVSPLSYGSNFIEDLALVPLSNTQKWLLMEEYGSMRKVMEAGGVFGAYRTLFRITPRSSELPKELKSRVKTRQPDKFARTKLLMTPWEMLEENYPLPMLTGTKAQKYKDFVSTRDEYSEVTDNSPMWAVDCEMCLTAKGNELTRISIVDEAHEVVYETLVKPHNKIINYLTQYSGITREMLRDVTVTLEDVQHHIRSICPPDCIFIGQSLNFDLIAMKMIHPYVIDTSLIFNLSGQKHRKSKLSVLTAEFLSERIQQGKCGHNPIEDSIAAMKLVQAKLQHSLDWGNAVVGGPRPEWEVEASRELLRQREEAGTATMTAMSNVLTGNVAQLTEQQELLSKSLFSHLTRYNKNVQLVGKQEQLDEWGRYFDPSLKVKVDSVGTNKLAIKQARNSSVDTSIVHITLNNQSEDAAVKKADKLVEKLLRNPVANTLYCVLLAGRPTSKDSGVLFLHLVREHIPFVVPPPPTL